MTALQKLGLTIGVLAIVGVGVYMVFYRGAAGPGSGPQAATSTPNGAATSTNPSAGLTLSTPDYKKPIAFSAGTSVDIRAQLNASLKLVQAQLDKNPLDIKAWVDLGTLHKMGGDYRLAAEYWEYLTSSYSGTGTPYYSLGDLYQNFIKDYAKAEANYLLAVKVQPANVDAYASLYTMYHHTLGDDIKAAAILEQGLKANPGNNYLLSLQAELRGN